MTRPPLKVFRLRLINKKPVRLFTNLDAVIYEGEDHCYVDGWATLSWGWLLDPLSFRKKHPNYCLFSRKEFHPQATDLVKAWLYTPMVHEFFKDPQDRAMFQCWVDYACLYEVELV
jgi:hypothetical protein